MRAVLCDDHLMLLQALASALDSRGVEVVGTVNEHAQIVPTVQREQPDVCLLDLSFPGHSGLDAVAGIRAAAPSTRVIVLSAMSATPLVQAALARGVDGFVRKESSVDVIVWALQTAVSGQMAVEPELLRQAVRPPDTNDPTWRTKFLTRREWEVGRCIVDGMGTDEIATRLGIGRSTARTHVQAVLNKLGVHSRLQVAALLSASEVLNEVTRLLGGS